jgi:putative transposase
MDISCCIEALKKALYRNEKPEILDTNQGSQFTRKAFTELLKKSGVAISMDGRTPRDHAYFNCLQESLQPEPENRISTWQSRESLKTTGPPQLTQRIL